MALTRDFRDTVVARLQGDAEFRDALLREAVELLLAGDLDTGKSLLRDYINGTIGFKTLGERTKLSPKSLMRMFSEKGNPQARGLFAVLSHLQAESGVLLKIRPQPRAARRRPLPASSATV